MNTRLVRRETCVVDSAVCPYAESAKKAFEDLGGKYTMPATALANDLVIFYAPWELYRRRVTVMKNYLRQSLPRINDLLRIGENTVVSARLTRRCICSGTVWERVGALPHSRYRGITF